LSNMSCEHRLHFRGGELGELLNPLGVQVETVDENRGVIDQEFGATNEDRWILGLQFHGEGAETRGVFAGLARERHEPDQQINVMISG